MLARKCGLLGDFNKGTKRSRRFPGRYQKETSTYLASTPFSSEKNTEPMVSPDITYAESSGTFVEHSLRH
uniref:Uncharacterized protein n=1 Tax=Rhodnius prolixus TaxID=13249 RepID=T1H8P9_RHOPR